MKLDEIAALAKQVTRSPDLERLCAPFAEGKKPPNKRSDC
jgi:hypothetical protein